MRKEARSSSEIECVAGEHLAPCGRDEEDLLESHAGIGVGTGLDGDDHPLREHSRRARDDARLLVEAGAEPVTRVVREVESGTCERIQVARNGTWPDRRDELGEHVADEGVRLTRGPGRLADGEGRARVPQ